MTLTIDIELDEATAFAIAEKLGMDMQVMEDPEEPSRPATFKEVDEWLEQDVKHSLIAKYAEIVKELKLKELHEELKATKAHADNEIEQAMGRAVSVGGSIKKTKTKKKK